LLRLRSLLVAVPALAAGLLAVSLVGAALSPGNQDFEAKWADWLRANHAGLLAQKFEEIYYSATAPVKGGRPKGLNHVPGVETSAADATTTGSVGTTGPVATTAAQARSA
jgi:hypothetical protein